MWSLPSGAATARCPYSAGSKLCEHLEDHSLTPLLIFATRVDAVRSKCTAGRLAGLVLLLLTPWLPVSPFDDHIAHCRRRVGDDEQVDISCSDFTLVQHRGAQPVH